MAIILNGSTYNNKKGLMLGGEFYTKIRLAVSLSGAAPAAGTAFSAVSLTVRAELPDVGITGAAAAAVTGYTRAAGTVAEGSNTITVSWNGISGSVTFNASGTSGGGGGEIVPEPGELASIMNEQITAGAFKNIGKTLALADTGKNYTIVCVPENPSGVIAGSLVELVNAESEIIACTMSVKGEYNFKVNYDRSEGTNPALTAKADAGKFTNGAGTAPAFFFWELPQAEVMAGASYSGTMWKLHAYAADGAEIELTEVPGTNNTSYAWLAADKYPNGYTNPSRILSLNFAARYLVFEKILSAEERAAVVAAVTYGNGGGI